MIIKFRLFFFLTLVLFSNLSMGQEKGDFDLPLGRYRDVLLTNKVSEEEVKSIMEKFDKSTGRWNDVDYDNKARTGWKTLEHLKRTLNLTKIYISGPSLSKDAKLLAAIELALNHWLNADYKNDNWFPNEVTVPSHFIDILIIMGNELNDVITSSMIEKISRIKIKSVGANLVYFSDIRLHYGLLVRDESIVHEAVKALEGVIVIQSNGVGIQSDYSYHFHDHRLQMFSYGRGFLVTTSRLAWELAGTQFAFSREKIDLLCDFVLEGWQWMARGPYTVPSTMDRSSTRKGALRTPRQLQTIDFLIETHPERRDELTVVREAQGNIKNFKLTGVKNFYRSDLVVSHTPQASLFIKTLSDRNLPTESINSENLQGKFLNAGNTYFMKNGQEYFNMLGSWDWSLLPGFTYVEGASRIKRHAFTGAIQYSSYSGSVMNYELLNSQKESIYAARKTWFVLDNQIMVALISPGNRGREAITAMDQSKWIGEIKGSFLNELESKGGSYNTEKPFWIYHNGWAYMSHSKLHLNLTVETKDSDWQGINARYSNQKETEEQVFKPVLISQGEAVEYAVAPVNNAFEAKKLFENRTWTVNLNSKDAQVITLKNGVIMAAVYKKNNKVRLSEQIEIAADQPILLIIEDDRMKISNLNPKQKKVNLTFNSTSMELDFDTIEGVVVSVPK